MRRKATVWIYRIKYRRERLHLDTVVLATSSLWLFSTPFRKKKYFLRQFAKSTVNHLKAIRDEIWRHFRNRWQGHNCHLNQHKQYRILLFPHLQSLSFHLGLQHRSYMYIYQCLLRVHRCTAGCVAKPSVMIHAEGRQRLGATQKLPGC